MSTKIAKTQRSKRAMAAKAPKLIEGVKSLVGIKGPKTSDMCHSVLRDLHKFKQPESVLLDNKRNITRPFEDVSSVEFLGKVNAAPLFSYASHSKKRPHNLILGRLYDHQLLDMFEFGIQAESFKPMAAFEGIRKAVVRVGSKPVMVFQGENWESNADLVLLKNFFLDFFRGEVLQKINLSALDRVIIFSATDAGVHFRHYGVILKKSSSALPRVELDEVGPRMDLVLRRRKGASPEQVAHSLKQPRQTSKKIFQKNIENNEMGDRVGRVHMQKQDLANLNISRLKGLKKRKSRDSDGAEGEANDEAAAMVDVDAPAAASARSSRPASAPAAPSASAVAKRMSGVSTNSMDEFASRSVASASSGRSGQSSADKNTTRKKAGGYGEKAIDGGYRNVAKKKKVQ